MSALGATAVTFPDDKNPKKQRANLDWSTSKTVTVRVSYLAHCGIPLARFFMCDSGRSLASGLGSIDSLAKLGVKPHQSLDQLVVADALEADQ